jgi:hypothetical protein
VLGHFFVVGSHTVQIRTVCTTRGRGHRNQGRIGMILKVVLRFFLAIGIYKTVHTIDCFHGFRGAYFLGGTYNNTDLACFSR